MIDFLLNNYWIILVALNYILAITAAFIIIFKNINPTKTMAYILVLVLFPFVGLLIYYFFGQEYRKNKLFNRKDILNRSIIRHINENLELNTFEKTEIKNILKDKVKLIKLLYTNQKSPLTIHNEVEIIENGDKKFEKLKKDLVNAKNHIHLEYYIFDDDTIGSEIISILCAKAKEGIKVRLSVDDVGSKLSKSALNKLKNHGVDICFFMPVMFSRFADKLNYRNHRKIAIIDGLIGYIGGINIADNYLNNNTTKRFWRDTHLRVEGEAVVQLQIHFLMTWRFVSNREIDITGDFFPENTLKTQIPIQVAASGPDTDWANIMEVIFTSIVTAKQYVYITTPYFIPNDEIISAIQIAARSGVEVKLLIPKESDSWTAKHATNSFLEPLLLSGVEVYRYTKGFIHAKTLVVDNIFCSVGTSNMDYRSFNLNFEINALLYSKQQATILKSHFLNDLKDSEKMNLKRWSERSSLTKFKESISRLFAPLL